MRRSETNGISSSVTDRETGRWTEIENRLVLAFFRVKEIELTKKFMIARNVQTKV